MKRTLMVIAVSSSILLACKKEKDNTPGCPVTMEGLSGAYKLTALQYKASASAASQDYLSFMDDCEKDNILTLKNDGTYKSDDAGTVCEPAEVSQGTWTLKGKTLISDGTLNGTVASYDCKTLVYYIDNAIAPGDKLTYTLEKQ